MKKQFSIIAAAIVLLMGVTSCNNDNVDEQAPSGEGKMSVTLGFEGLRSTTRATVSTVLPTTSWANNIKDLKLIMVQSNIVKVVRTLDLPTNTGIGAQTFSLTGIPEGTYNTYVVANLGQAEGPAVYGVTGTATPVTFVPGDNFNTKLYALKEITPWNTTIEGTGTTGHSSPAEIFIGNALNVTINEATPATPSIVLTRAVSLLRVRLDITSAGHVSFLNAGASIRLRRHGSAINLTSGNTLFKSGYWTADHLVNATTNTNFVFSSSKQFKDAAAFNTAQTVGRYSAGNMLTDNYTLWNDYLILPGGGVSAAGNQFNIAIAGVVTQNDYVNADGVKLPAGSIVWWQGAITKAIAANGILDVAVKFTTPGGGDGTGTVPPVTNYGKLDLTVNLANWGTISGVNIDI